MMQFDLADLRLLAAIADEGNLTRGAARARTSASAASLRVKSLESRLGVKLLMRHARGVRLTPPGDTFARHARILLGQVEHLDNDLRKYTRGVKGALRIAACATAVCEFLPAVVGRYLAMHPEVDLDLHERVDAQVLRALHDGSADVGIVSGPVHAEGLEMRAYRDDPLVLVVPRRHALAKAAATRFVDTLAFDHIGLVDGVEGGVLQGLLQAAACAQGRGLRCRMQVGSAEASCRLVQARAGVGIMPASAAHRYARELAVCVVALTDDWSRRTLQICTRSFTELAPFARALVDLLVADGASEGARGR